MENDEWRMMNGEWRMERLGNIVGWWKREDI